MKTDMKYTKEAVDEIKTKLDKFIECVDKKYATKEEVSAIKTEMNFSKNKSNTWIIQVVGWAIVISLFIFDKL